MNTELHTPFITAKSEFEKYFDENQNFPQDLYEVLMEQIELAELSGYSWIIFESNEEKPIAIMFDAFDNEDENMTSISYKYADFV